jgi:acyl-homoserine-lactone acylase
MHRKLTFLNGDSTPCPRTIAPAGPARWPALALLALLVPVLPSTPTLAREPGPTRVEEAADKPAYSVTVRRGSFGVAHIKADDFGSLGYGEGYAAAEDHLCNIAQGVVQARGAMARYFGPGVNGEHVNADALYKAMAIRQQAEEALAEQSATIRQWVTGYSAGYNRYLLEHPGPRNDSWCSGAPWLVEAKPVDFLARLLLVVQTLPQMSGAVLAAQPPENKITALQSSQAELLANALDAAALTGHGSNGWALGSEMTDNGRGLLLANPHYPWYGGRRFWEKHLTIPGELDTYGVGLLGAPGVFIGFNRKVGWTHTVSASQRIVLYRLALDPKDPLRYRFGEKMRRLEKRSVSVPVLGDDGELRQVDRGVYFSHYGPLLQLPGAPWSAEYAYSARDANAGNHRVLAQWLAMSQADSMDAFIDAHRRDNAMPWVNTIATSADGRAVYLDNSSTGYLAPDAQQRWRDSLARDRLAAGLYQQRGLVLLDGSDPRNSWIEDPAATIAGTTPFTRRPFLERRDYVFNSNDSYWLTSPRQPLTAYSVLYGPTSSARSLRTRMNIRLLENAYGDAGADGRFNREEVQEALFANRGLGAELLLDALVETCRAASDRKPGLAHACEVLDNYDGTLNLDSPGAVLFREWIERYDGAERRSANTLFARDFDPALPAQTPAGLGDRDTAIANLEGALRVLQISGIPPEATLRQTQFAYRAGRAIPVHGGTRAEGVANLQEPGDPGASPIAAVAPRRIADSHSLTDAGYPIVHGSSFIMVLGFTEQGPAAEALLSYSQSGNPNSPHFDDQTERYRDKAWRPVVFDEAAVEADVQSTRVLRSGDPQRP